MSTDADTSAGDQRAAVVFPPPIGQTRSTCGCLTSCNRAHRVVLKGQ